MLNYTMLKAVNESHQNGECRIDEPITDENRGDGLASFIRTEIIEVCEGEDDHALQVELALNAMLSAREQLDDVISALEDLL